MVKGATEAPEKSCIPNMLHDRVDQEGRYISFSSIESIVLFFGADSEFHRSAVDAYIHQLVEMESSPSYGLPPIKVATYVYNFNGFNN